MLFVRPQENQSLWIPKHNKVFTDTVDIECKHLLTGENQVFTSLKDQDVNSGYYIFIGLDFSKFDSGEYEYRLISNGYQKETGLLQVMTRLTEPISYKHNNKTIVYNGQ